MSEEWSLKDKITADTKFAEIYYAEDIETLRKKLIEDIDYIIDFWRNDKRECAKYYIDAFLSCKHNINERFGHD